MYYFIACLCVFLSRRCVFFVTLMLGSITILFLSEAKINMALKNLVSLIWVFTKLHDYMYLISNHLLHMFLATYFACSLASVHVCVYMCLKARSNVSLEEHKPFLRKNMNKSFCSCPPPPQGTCLLFRWCGHFFYDKTFFASHFTSSTFEPYRLDRSL